MEAHPLMHEQPYVRPTEALTKSSTCTPWRPNKETPEICELPHCMLLFGLTISNYSRENPAAFLRRIADHALTGSAIQSSSIFYYRSLTQRRKDYKSWMGRKLYPDEWCFHSERNYILGRHEASLIPRGKDIELGPPLEGVVVWREEKGRFGCSYKYDQQE
ncbi:hypothetical protein EYZ11_009150 [Aspergillus tanneri]|uniref:Uncharacterized protein n=1 Tax=Aspergillus tanneri TaxID=1220188 RepID=A0A4S3J906_9EURO|nr:hypothetical protein EYZ11_009150 [Aspergillus tanneri]